MFYALPQAPQQFKQLLMVAGLDRYFQIAPCFRDEDPRADRHPGEFYQLDLEMSFVTQEEILNLIEELYTDLVKKILPDHVISQTPFPRMTYAEAMKNYGTDKPDLRKDKNNPKELAFAFVVDFPMFEWSEREKRWSSAHHPFTMMKEQDLKFIESKEYEKVRADSYDFVLNGYEMASGSIRINKPEVQKMVFETLGLSEEQINEKFGHIIEAFKYGAPPHGGIAPGIDRFLMIVSNEPNIREVIAFPKTGDGKDFMMGAPSGVDEGQLGELGLEIKTKG
jgi:aspartyl-tRNA synthetase